MLGVPVVTVEVATAGAQLAHHVRNIVLGWVDAGALAGVVWWAETDLLMDSWSRQVYPVRAWLSCQPDVKNVSIDVQTRSSDGAYAAVTMKAPITAVVNSLLTRTILTILDGGR